MDARQDNLPDPLLCQKFSFPPNFFQRARAYRSARKWNNAVSTEFTASFLNFDISTVTAGWNRSLHFFKFPRPENISDPDFRFAGSMLFCQ